MWVHEKPFSIHINWTRKSAVLWVLWFFFMIAQCGAMSLLHSYLWRIYQTFFVNGLAGYHLMMSKQRFCTNLNSFFAEGEPKLCLCFVLVATFSFWSSRRKKKTNSWQKSSLQRYWPKIPIWVTWYIWAFDHFFYIALHCIVQTEEWGYLPSLKRKVYQTIIEIGWGPKGLSFSFLSVGLKSETKQFSGCILIFNIKHLYDTEYCAEWPTIKGELSDPIGPSK